MAPASSSRPTAADLGAWPGPERWCWPRRPAFRWCRLERIAIPALREPHKWDQPRNPVPFCRLAISMEAPLEFNDFADTSAMETARQSLEEALTEASDKAHHALGLAAE